MGVNSRKKGNKAERIAAALVSKWTNRKFARTPSSGGLQWKASFTKGDIVCAVDKHYCPFCFEIKNHKEINFSELLIPNKKGVKILEFWKQCERDAKKCNKVPILMMRYNGMPKTFFFIVIPWGFMKRMNIFARALSIKKTLTFWDKNDKEGEILYIVPSTEFFKLPYKEISLLAKTYLKNGKEKN